MPVTLKSVRVVLVRMIVTTPDIDSLLKRGNTVITSFQGQMVDIQFAG